MTPTSSSRSGRRFPEFPDEPKKSIYPSINEDPQKHGITNQIEGHESILQKSSIRRAIIDLLASLSDEQPLVLFVEDCHWADDATLEIFSDLGSRSGSLRLAVILTSRNPDLSGPSGARLCENIFHLPLGKLSTNESRDLAQAVCNRHLIPMSDEVADWIEKCGEGNPLQIQALTEHWAVYGTIDGIPLSLNKLLQFRLSQLPEHALRLLQATMLLDRHASIENLRIILEIPNYELLNALEALEAHQCLTNNTSAVILAHELIGKAALRILPRSVECAMRSTIASRLENLYLESGNLELLVDALQHLETTNRTGLLLEKILTHKNALYSSRHPSIPETVNRLLSNEPVKESDRKHLAALQSRISANAGEFGKALNLLPNEKISAKDVLYRPIDDVVLCISHIESAFRSDPLADPKELGDIAQAIATASHFPLDVRLRASDIGLVIAGNTCDQQLGEACFSWTNQIQDPDFPKPIRYRLGVLFHTVFGSTQTACRIANMLVESMADLPPSAQTATEIGRVGYVFRMLGEVEPARAAFSKSLQLANDLKLPRLTEYPLWQLAQIAVEAGEIHNAKSLTNELLLITNSNGDPHANSFVYSHLCLLALAQRDYSSAQSHLASCKQSLPLIPHIRSLAFSLALEILIKTAEPDWSPPPGILEVAHERFEKTSRFAASDLITAALLELLTRCERFDDASSILADYLKNRRRERGDLSVFLSSASRKLNDYATAKVRALSLT